MSEERTMFLTCSTVTGFGSADPASDMTTSRNVQDRAKRARWGYSPPLLADLSPSEIGLKCPILLA